MAKKTERVRIDNEEYAISQLGAVEGLELYHELVRAFGPALRDELSQYRPAEETMARVLLRAIELMPRELMRELRQKFAANSKVKSGELMVGLGEGDIFDQHFAGRYGLLTKWLLACLKVNFADFLAGSGNLGGPPPGTSK